MLNKIVLTLALVAAQLISLAQADGYAVMKN